MSIRTRLGNQKVGLTFQPGETDTLTYRFPSSAELIQAGASEVAGLAVAGAAIEAAEVAAGSKSKVARPDATDAERREHMRQLAIVCCVAVVSGSEGPIRLVMDPADESGDEGAAGSAGKPEIPAVWVGRIAPASLVALAASIIESGGFGEIARFFRPAA